VHSSVTWCNLFSWYKLYSHFDQY